MDEFCSFPAFPLLFWHKRFLLFQISCLQVDLKKNQLVSYRMSFDGIYYSYDVTCWLLAPADFLLHLCLFCLRAVELILAIVVMQYFVIAAVHTHCGCVCFAMI